MDKESTGVELSTLKRSIYNRDNNNNNKTTMDEYSAPDSDFSRDLDDGEEFKTTYPNNINKEPNNPEPIHFSVSPQRRSKRPPFTAPFIERSSRLPLSRIEYLAFVYNKTIFSFAFYSILFRFAR